MKIDFKKIEALPNLLLFLAVFLIFLKPPTDPDFGWHLQTGRYILQNHRIPTENLFSYNFPDFKYADFYWIPQVIFALVVDNLGLFALSVLCALTMTVAVFIAGGERLGVRGKSLGGSSSFLLAVLLSAILIHPTSGVRPLVFGSLFFAIFLRLLRRLSSSPTSLPAYIPTILLFFLWSNFYGDFLFSLLILWSFWGLSLLILLLPKKSRSLPALSFLEIQISRLSRRQLFFAGLFSTLATFLTPNGFFLWQTLIGSITKLQLRTIAEWLPLSTAPPFVFFFAGYVGLLLVLLWKRRAELRLVEIIPVLAFLPFSIRSAYYTRPLALAATDFLSKNLSLRTLLDQEIILPISPLKIRIAWLTFFGLLLFGLLPNVVNAYGGAASPAYLASFGGYPFNAVQFLGSNHQEGRVFNEYAWGGYLSWQLPELKLFIYGGMSAWREEETEILKDYNALYATSPGFSKLLKDYRISWVLLKPEAPLAKLLKENGGWEVVYEDKISIVIRKIS